MQQYILIQRRERRMDMKDNTSKNIRMELLIQQYKKKFETEENLNYYEYKDFVQAERKYLDYAIDSSFDTCANA